MSAPAADDAGVMRRALELAGNGWGRVHPNPMVGAVLVRDGRVVGEGWHAEHGGAHAEIAAIESAGPAAAGATLFVTLEPCAHRGKTPACTDAVIAAGVRRVVFAAHDPNPAAAGGERVLRAAGLDVLAGVEAAAARRQNRIFFHLHEQQRIYLALKLAVTVDGALGTRGARTQITGEAANEATQRLRAGFDALMVGAETARVDDPVLTVRGAVQPRVAPARIVVDTRLRLRPNARLLRTVHEAPVLVVCGGEADEGRAGELERAGATVVHVRSAGGRVDLADALHRLWERGMRSILCEGGGRLGAELLARGLVDALHVLIAPRLIGAGGVPAFPLAGAPPGAWRLDAATTLGRDVALELRRVRAGEDACSPD